MQKLLELEKKLKEAKDMLEKIGGGQGMPGSVATSGGPSIASQIGFGKKEEIAPEGSKNRESYKKEFGKKEKHEDEKEDKKMIAEALDRHNEKKHDEDKDEDSAKKDMGLKKARQDATVIENGKIKTVSPKEQVESNKAAQAARKAKTEAEENSKKSKAEAEAAARRASYKQDGVLKMEMCKSDAEFALEELNMPEELNFSQNGQWSLIKSKSKGSGMTSSFTTKIDGPKTEWGTGSHVADAREAHEKSKKQPVKVYTKEEVEAENEKRNKK